MDKGREGTTVGNCIAITFFRTRILQLIVRCLRLFVHGVRVLKRSASKWFIVDAISTEILFVNREDTGMGIYGGHI